MRHPDAALTVGAEAGASSLLTVRRGLEVLRAFHGKRMPLSNAELVRRTGLSKAVVSRLTTTLVQLGHLSHVPGGRQFELSVGPVSIGNAFSGASPLMRLVEPTMQELADKLDVSVALAIADQLEMLYLGYKVGPRVATLRLGVGSLLPMGITAIGRAWLWGLDAARRNETIALLCRAAGEQGAAMEQGIRGSFVELEATGICTVLGGYQRDAYGIALPLCVGQARVPMALSCGAVDVQVDLEAERRRIGPPLRAAAARLECLLADFDGQP